METLSFLTLPKELIDAVLRYLSPGHLAAFSQTCHDGLQHSRNDLLWHEIIKHNLPGLVLTKPDPFPSYRELYVAYHNLWFIPRQKLWFCDRSLTGQVVLARYSSEHGTIEGCRLLATRGESICESWLADPNVVIHSFHPNVNLFAEKPDIYLSAPIPSPAGASEIGAGYAHVAPPPLIPQPFTNELAMFTEAWSSGLRSNLMLAQALPYPDSSDSQPDADPHAPVWPPLTIPAKYRVKSARLGQSEVALFTGDRPQSWQQVCQTVFRTRQWMSSADGTPSIVPPSFPRSSHDDSSDTQRRSRGLRAGLLQATLTELHITDGVSTYSTLDPTLYTPTMDKPWRGIWVGDYSGHGCEFLLIHQPDDNDNDSETSLTNPVRDVSSLDRTHNPLDASSWDSGTYRGRLEAIKLTGDPHVPRGEPTFIVDDLGPRGQLGVATEPPFSGARMVRSKGHIASLGFNDGLLRPHNEEASSLNLCSAIGFVVNHCIDAYVESRLIMISHSRLAQHWIAFGHISYFERIDIDNLLYS